MVSLTYFLLSAVALSTMCGASQAEAMASSRIVNGIAAEYSNFPYAMSLQQVSLLSQVTRGHTCGGAMITLRHAVTNGACLYLWSGTAYVLRNASEYRVFAGSHLLTNDTSADRWRSVSLFTPHPNYTGPTSVVNDIAIITVTSAFPSGVVVPFGVSTTVPADGANCTVAGWGATLGGAPTSVNLLYANKQTMNQAACGNSSVAAGGPTVQSTMICTFNTAISPSCTGDSGSALVCGRTLAGVLSWFSACNVASGLEIYTRTASFAGWANGVTGGAGVAVAPMGLFAALAMSKILATIF